FKSVGIGNKGRIVIYGDLKGLFAARAFVTLDYLGHGDRVALLDGGLEKWKSEGRNVSTENVKRENAGFSPDLEVDRVIHLNEVKGVSWSITNLRTAKYSLIDARPGDSYKGITKSKSLERNGHIPGAKNVYWKDHLESDKNPVMKSVKELRALYAGKGLRADKTVITYCQTGGQASHAYFTLKYLGYDVKLYDGSFFEWSRAKGTKVVSFAEVE
ncbi:MAG: sulfurtransferase, partial [Pyrinomonadaceae bacterium]|nr:sulfurtransferase [Pyrinomonadaceae bacterium]